MEHAQLALVASQQQNFDKAWPNSSACCAASGAAGFFRQQAAAATHTHWQLIQLASTSTPGVFKASFRS